MADSVKEVAGWLGLIGVPSIGALICGLVRWIRFVAKQIAILQKAQKAQMRSQLLSQYQEYSKQGYITQIQLDDWMNQEKAYHALVGDNEVLEERKKELIKLPNEPLLNQMNTFINN